MLSWAPVSGAVRYEVLVDDDPAFASPYGGATPVTTVNTTYVPTAPLSAATNYWRVRAVNNSSERSTWSDSLFNAPRISTPQPASPPDNATLHQPSDPPLLTWAAAAGAQSYLVEVDGDDTLDTPQYSYTTKSTSLVVPDSLAGRRLVLARDRREVGRPRLLPRATADASSSTRSTRRPPSRPSATPRPGRRAGLGAGAGREDLRGPGRHRRLLHPGRLAHRLGHRHRRHPYSRPITYDNASYFWRVRAVDVDGQATAWRTTSVGDQHTFTRNFPGVPQLVHPAAPGAETVNSPAYFQWTPVKHASEYELQVGTDPSSSRHVQLVRHGADDLHGRQLQHQHLGQPPTSSAATRTATRRPVPSTTGASVRSTARSPRPARASKASRARSPRPRPSCSSRWASPG